MIKALRIESENVTRFAEIDEVPLLPDHVRVRVRHVGLCGSDLNTFKGLNPLVQLPRIPGHEIGGEIMETGAGVDATRYAAGRRVIVLPYTNCGECTACRKGRLNACRYNKTLGVQQNGGLADEIVLPAEKLILNDTLEPRHLALVEPLSVGFHAVARGRVGSGDTVAVLGCGMIGMGVLIGAVARGAKVIAIDPSAEKRELALRLGAAHVLTSGDHVVETVTELTAGDGVDIALEAVGLPITFTQAVDLACFAGRVVYVGYSKAPVTYQTQFFNLKELDIMGSRNATLADFEAVISHLEKLGPEADSLISKIFPFTEAEEALPYWDANRNDVLKIVIERV
ncbi:sorbitol dehydrogenase [Phyllobacterium salinisoli]|uniref:Sorbitol dehydrogenase n=1 Tax=Phyllobacterium salinisoli TaxID=1899321 RepID=A0A368K164_9HYPH|nr:zinc-binding alcohol dehydrogenase family protein [Phyllobacterium salinisoli]RCS22961.1 sorbitol dehydrogenase [Phyllobacterium salinisoli]